MSLFTLYIHFMQFLARNNKNPDFSVHQPAALYKIFIEMGVQKTLNL